MILKKFFNTIMYNKKYIALLFVILCIVTYSTYLTYKEEWSAARMQPRYVSSLEGDANSEIQYSLQNGEVVRQRVRIHSTEITGLALFFAHDKIPQQGLLTVDLLEENTGDSVAHWERNVNTIETQSICNFVLDSKITINTTVDYLVQVTVVNIEPESMLLTCFEVADAQNVGMCINGQQSEYAMQISFINGNHSILKYLLLALYFIMIATITIMAILFLKNVKLEWIFVAFTLGVGCLYLLALPPFTVPDEASHFVTTYAHSSQLLGEPVVDDAGEIIVSDARLWGAGDSFPSKESYVKHFYGLLGRNTTPESGAIGSRTPLEMKHPGYAPQVAGVTIGRIFNFNCEQLLLIGKVFSLFWYAFIMYWAIKLIPFGKMALFTIGSLPMTIQMIVSYNYDAILLGVCFFTTAYLLYLIYKKEKVGIKEMLLLSVLGITIASIKFVYLPILGLILFIPKTRYHSGKAKFISTVLVYGLSIVTLLCIKLSMILYVSTPRVTYSTNPGEAITIGYALRHLREMFNIFYRTFEHQASYYLESMVASPLGWLEIRVPNIVVYGFVVILLLSLLVRSDEKKYTCVRIQCFSWVLAVSMAILSLVALLLDCTNMGAGQIAGFQGRYFLPFLPMLLVMLRNQVIVVNRNIERYIVLTLVSLHCMTIFYVTLTIIGR